MNPDENTEADALVLVGHGTRHETGQQQFLKLAEQLRSAVRLPVEVAYIELQQPTIQEALISLHARGVKRVILSPALLFAAGHAKRDIPEAVQAAQLQCPGLQVRIAEPLGCHDAVLKLAAARVEGSLSPQNDSDTALVLIGRGSSDPAAIAHCREFACLLAQRLAIEKVFTGFIAMAQPDLPTALAHAAASGARRIVVQPHLLFAGEMLETTTSAVAAAQRKHAEIVWQQAEILGSDLQLATSKGAPFLIQALLARSEVPQLFSP